MELSIENIFKALEIVDSLSADDFYKFKKHLEVIDDKFAKQIDGGIKRNIPPYNPRPLRSENEAKPEFVLPPPPRPPASMSTCSCSSFFGLIPVHPSKCTCRGGK